MDDITFDKPELLYLLFLLVPMIVWYIIGERKSRASLQISTIQGFEKAPITWKHYVRHVLFFLQMGVISLLIVCLARPQSFSSWENSTTKGIDVVISLDVSSSMKGQDFTPNRMGAAKKIGQEFIAGRHNDRVGLVVFSGESFTQCPLTTDHATLMNLMQEIEIGMIEDGTAIGEGLATAVNRLKDSDAKSRVIILLTDGENNKGEIAPKTAADIAKEFGIRVYTIGLGTNGMAPYPVETPFGTQVREVEVKIDEELLTEMAESTGGKYFRATDNEALVRVYEQIDKLEKSKIDVKQFSKKEEKYHLYAAIALGLLILGVVLNNTVFRNIP